MAPDYYSSNAKHLFEQYRAVAAETVHAAWRRQLLRDEPGLAGDIGAGSGRDANWLASLGWNVVAVEPNDALRELAEAASDPRVQWINDQLPALNRLRRAGHRFDLILVSAVWMHVAPTDRKRAMRVLSELLAPGGTLIMTLRSSAREESGRGFYPVSADELRQLAADRAIASVLNERSDDALERDGVQWQTLGFRLPDDGTGSLPLLRHIIVNDDKSSTYKLGLLRTLIRIAESMPGMVTRWDEETVEIPLGLVGLVWIRLYHPLLLKHDFLQAPPRRDGARPGFAKEAFYALEAIPPATLRVGAKFQPESANTIIRAIRDACRLIRDMPAHYITFPGTSNQVFQCDYQTVLTGGSLQVDKDTLSRFGTFRIPRNIWMTMGQFACWLEPAIVNEWKLLMQGWQVRYQPGNFDNAMAWEVSQRDTNVVRQLVTERIQRGDSVRCVWTDKKLRLTHCAIDHCLPWAHWPNNDLWNLLPATSQANSRKRDAVPSADLMVDARPRILEWWEEASDAGHSERFYLEAEAALPNCDGADGLSGVFEALQHQRIRLVSDQRLREWAGL